MPIGGYSAGCLNGGRSVQDGPGLLLMRTSRNRTYGHPVLVEFVQTIGKAAVDKGLGTILIGDLSQPRGGPMKSGHRSHQIGLDVDVWFRRLPPGKNGKPEPTLATFEREKLGSPSVIQDDHLHTEHWSASSGTLLELFASRSEVDRIFVNPVIKRELCIQLQQSGKKDWLRKIRPWWGHDSHFHVRLKCPAEAVLCRATEKIPAGDGCDESLNWWFSEEAAELANQSEPAEPPILPNECESVLDQL